MIRFIHFYDNIFQFEYSESQTEIARKPINNCLPANEFHLQRSYMQTKNILHDL